MKTNSDIGRREFLENTTAVIGLAALAHALGGCQSTVRRNDSSAAIPDGQELDKLLTQMEADGPMYLKIPRADGHFLSLLIRATQARRVLEIGTSHGYTGIWLARGLEETGGRLTTIEILADRVEMAKKHVKQAGLDHRFTFLQGDAHQIVPTLQGPFDFVFLNADKGGGVDYFQKLFPKKLAPGAMLVAYSAIQSKEKMQPYLDLVSRHPDFETVVLSCTMEDGMALSCRKRA